MIAWRNLAAPMMLVSALAGCAPAGGGRGAVEEQGGRLTVLVTIPPQLYLVERIGNGHVAAELLIPPGRDPHTFELQPRQMLLVSKARLFFKIGLPIEHTLLEKLQAQHERLTVVDTTRGIQKRAMTDEHRHAAAGHDHEGEPDPHVWLSPPLLKIQAGNVAEALEEADPAHADEYRKNLAALIADIDAVDARIRGLMKPYRGRTFFVFHPSFGYFADAYGLTQEAVEVGGKSPTPRQLHALIETAKAQGVRIIFVQPQFDQRAAQAVAQAIGGSVEAVDPLAKDVLKNLEDVAAKIKQALASQG